MCSIALLQSIVKPNKASHYFVAILDIYIIIVGINIINGDVDICTTM